MDDESSVIYCTDVEKLQKIVRMKERLKRPISRSTLEIAPGLKLGIGFYSFARLEIFTCMYVLSTTISF